MDEPGQTTEAHGALRQWFDLGFYEIIPVMPPWAELHEHSNVDPAMRGKVPGEFYGGKWDGMGGWPTFQMTIAGANMYDGYQANGGLKMGAKWCAIDVDCTDETLSHLMLQYLQQAGAPVRVGQAPKFLVLFRVIGEPVRRQQYQLKKEGVEGRQLFEVMGQSAKGFPTQAVIVGTHPSGSLYTWDRHFRPEDVPMVTQETVDGWCAGLAQIAQGRGWELKKSNVNTGDGTGSDLGAKAFDPQVCKQVVSCIDNDDLPYDDWTAVGYAIKAAVGDFGWHIFEEWSARSAEKYDARVTKRMWDGYEPHGGAGMGKLVYLARHSRKGLSEGLEAAIKSDIAKATYENAVKMMPASATLAKIFNAEPEPQPGGTGLAPESPSSDLILHYVRDGNDNLIPNYANVEAWLWNVAEWQGCFQQDLFTGIDMVVKDYPEMTNHELARPVEDSDFVAVTGYLQRFSMPRVSKGNVADAVTNVAQRNGVNPVRAYLNGLVWDGVSRLGSWLFTYGNVIGDPFYVGEVGMRWMISAVARAMQPGVQADHALILEGHQGVGKSSLLRLLCPDEKYFGADLPDFHTKDASEYVAGKWIIEMAELTSIARSEVESMRSFLTRTTDVFRPAYARKEVRRPRQCVFAGSTNRDDYLRDHAGERRMWIVRVGGHIDLELLMRDRDQLWAEAVACYQAGHRWHLDSAVEQIATSIQQSRVEVDPWVEILQYRLRGITEIAPSVAAQYLELDMKNQNSFSTKRLKAALMALGFQRDGVFTAGDFKALSKYSRDSG